MSPHFDPVLVVGTTPDYIERISGRYPDRAVFLTDPDAYSGDGPFRANGAIQVFSSLREKDESYSKLTKFLVERNISLGGVACFDCESLLLAAEIAGRMSLPFPGGSAVAHARDKMASRRLWRERGVRCPRAIMARDDEDVIALLRVIGGPVVLKPTALSGSELTYICERPPEAREALKVIREGLLRRSRDRILNRDHMINGNAVMCEEYVSGDEYSCDFIKNGSEITIIRTARKYMMDEGPAGTVKAYEVPGMSSDAVSQLGLHEKLCSAAEALGLDRCMGMADFIDAGGEICFLEITPRPGGDCLPQVIEYSSGMDMLKAHIDYSSGIDPGIPPEDEWKPTIGLRIHSRRRGRLTAIRLWADRANQEILETGWYREPGERIGLPPEDYKTWVIGHVIFRPVKGTAISEQIADMASAVDMKIE